MEYINTLILHKLKHVTQVKHLYGDILSSRNILEICKTHECAYMYDDT
jgi:hypothetical protein